MALDSILGGALVPSPFMTQRARAEAAERALTQERSAAAAIRFELDLVKGERDRYLEALRMIVRAQALTQSKLIAGEALDAMAPPAAMPRGPDDDE